MQEYVREPLGMTNSRIGYVYLVDENAKIRWAACADAKEEEEEALIRCAGVLLNRHKRPSFTRTPSPPERQRGSEEK
jgi:mitochondrial ATPase complex subunit ATP10